jgi:hypothetical protein
VLPDDWRWYEWVQDGWRFAALPVPFDERLWPALAQPLGSFRLREPVRHFWWPRTLGHYAIVGAGVIIAVETISLYGPRATRILTVPLHTFRPDDWRTR